MPELDDVQIDQPVAPRDDRPGPRRTGLVVLLILVVCGVIAGAAWYFFLRPQEADEPVEEVTAPQEVVAGPAEESTAREAPEEIELPPLDASDEVVRRLVQELSEQPALASWLATEGLVRRFVVAVDNLAVGISPRKQLASMAPEGELTTTEGPEGGLRIAPEAYERYDRVAAVVASIDAAGAVETYRRIGPLVDEAAAAQGYSPEQFDQRLTRAILHLLETPVPVAPPELERKVLSYHYADPRFESLSDAQKQLLRMGPRNQRLIQGKLREVARELGVPPERIPPG